MAKKKLAETLKGLNVLCTLIIQEHHEIKGEDVEKVSSFTRLLSLEDYKKIGAIFEEIDEKKKNIVIGREVY